MPTRVEAIKSIRDAVDILVEYGYKSYPPGARAAAFLQRRLGQRWPACLTNDKTTIDVEFFDMTPYGNAPPVANVEIVGEHRVASWCRLQVYSISMPQLIRDIKQIENELVEAWVAMTKNRGRSLADLGAMEKP